eukprot:431002-Prorocentrum_minimum.AAC.1
MSALGAPTTYCHECRQSSWQGDGVGEGGGEGGAPGRGGCPTVPPHAGSRAPCAAARTPTPESPLSSAASLHPSGGEQPSARSAADYG